MVDDRLLTHADAIRVHTWLAKEFSALAFEDYLLHRQLEKFGAKFVAKYNTHVFSQTYEDAAIAEIFSRIGAASKTFIEIGAGDGSENTTRFLLMLGWRGLWVESDEANGAAIRNGFARELASGQLHLVQDVAAPENIQSLIDRAGLGSQVDFLSIDIDLHTHCIFRAITTGVRAACVEYNAHFPPSVEYETPYEPGEFWNGANVYGASLKSLEIIGQTKGLSLVGCDLHGVNAYFVASNLTGDQFPTPFTAETHYQPARFPFVRGQRGHRRQQPHEMSEPEQNPG